MWEESPRRHLSHNQYYGYTMPRAIMIFASRNCQNTWHTNLKQPLNMEETSLLCDFVDDVRLAQHELCKFYYDPHSQSLKIQHLTISMWLGLWPIRTCPWIGFLISMQKKMTYIFHYVFLDISFLLLLTWMVLYFLDMSPRLPSTWQWIKWKKNVRVQLGALF